MATNNDSATATSDTSGPFPATSDTLISQLVSGNPQRAQEALATLCARYRQPVLFWVLRRGASHESAEDLVQGFMQYLLEKNRFERYVRGQAKFRSFLLECLKRFCRDEWRKQIADKRGGGEVPISLEDHEVSTQPDLDSQLDREFALAVHRQAMRRLEQRFFETGKADRFQELRRFVWGDDPAVSYAEVAMRLGMKPNAVKKAVFDLRESYLDFFRHEVAQTTSPGSLDDELRYLISLLADTDATAPS